MVFDKHTFWKMPPEQHVGEFLLSPQGLSDSEVLERQKKYGHNEVKSPPQHFIRQFLSRFLNPLILILLVASAISAFSGEVTGFLIILSIILMSVVLDFYQQFRAEKAAEKLKSSVALTALTLREGVAREIKMSQIVPGDIVLLRAGDIVPADGIVLEERDIFINQSLVTGESYPVEKKPLFLKAPQDMTEARHAVFGGTSVVTGTARILIVRTGAQTVLGEMSATLTQAPPPTGFDLGIRHFGYLIMRLTVALVLFVLLINVLFHRPLLESFLFAIALAVGLTPELLPMIITVTLSRGALRMAQKSVIVKRLSSIQNLGGMDVLCSDKTGTLTEGKVVLQQHVDIHGVDNEFVLYCAYLNSYFETGYKSPLDQAILEHENLELTGWQKIDEVPFDFERRRVSVLLQKDTRRFLVVKGALEEILRLSSFSSLDSWTITGSFSEEQKNQFWELSARLEGEGYRGIGVAWKEVDSSCDQAHVSDETELVFAGLAAFHDPPKAGVKLVLKSLEEAHVSIRVVTGDSEWVARHLFDSLDKKVTGVLTGAEIEEMDDLALQARVSEVNLFCRVSPAQKNRIILAFKKRGHIVGYLGDGANDAPSLHSADVGISVEGAVDVAKEAADIVLLKHDLKTLLSGIMEGRRTHVNIMKYIMMATSSNFGNMFSMAGATLILPFLPMLPLQVLLNNFLYDISEVAIPMDRVDPSRLKEPTKWDIGFVHRYMWVLGLISSFFDFLTFYILIHVFKADEDLFHTGWFVESIATQVLVIFVIRTRYSPWRSRPSGALVVTSLCVVFLAACLPFSPFAAELGFVPLKAEFFWILAGILLSYLFLVEVVKRWFYHAFSKGSGLDTTISG